jgi:hypothetical protein
MIKLSEKELVTASDDCTLKFWNIPLLKVEFSLVTETITCVLNTGKNKELIVAGCHSGNFVTLKTSLR